MTTIRKVDHVAIAVASIAETVPLFCDTLQGEFIAGGDNDDTGIRLVHLRLPGFKLELMQPLRADSFLQRHLDERGPGFHHMTFFVDDLRTTGMRASTRPVGWSGDGVPLAALISEARPRRCPTPVGSTAWIRLLGTGGA